MTALLLLRRFWPVIAALAALAALYAWHSHAVTDAYRRGASAQGEVDKAAFAAAEQLATAEQDATIAAVRETSDSISKDTENALAAKNVDLSRRYAGLRELWLASRADPSSASSNAAVAVPGATGGAYGSACAGAVDIEIAIAASEAADVNAAQVNGWIDWYTAQAAAWPK